ncbi:MAG: hypothetical protein Q9199_003476 [Rusavskia elegans]
MYNPFRSRSTDPGRIHEDDIEKALSQFCAPPAFDRKTRCQPSISDSTFKRISELLNHLQAHHHARGWSDRPRTYTVLRNIKRLDLFQPFIDLGLNDIAFPYTIEKIPDLIQDDLKDRFLRHQRYILTTASHLENGQHALTKNGDDLFRLVRHLGRGNFGSVDLVWSRMSFREYARKQFLRKTSSKADQKILKNFESELTNLKRLSHEHLVRVVGSYTDQRSVAFLMEPVADMNLLTFLENFNRNREGWSPSLRSYFGCLANAVGYLHTQRIRHRDLKPANILVKDFKVYIADFGTARDWSLALNDTTTDNGIPVTAPYVAPEVAHRSPRNSAADMWSLGVVFLEMVTVLRGQSLPKMRRFIANHGTRHPYVHSNGPATTQWFEELRLNGQGPVSDNEPLSWIKDLTQLEPQRRPKPWALTSQIRSSFSSTAFIGICCADEDEIHDYPSPPLTANSEEEAPLQEQLEALGFFTKPHGSLMQPQKQSSLEQWRDHVLPDTPSPYTMTLWDDSVFDEPYEMFEDESVEARDFTVIQGGYGSSTGETRDHTIIESCYGYEIAEDDSDDEKKTEENGYEIIEDSSGSERTVCPSSPQLRAESLAPLNGENGLQYNLLPLGSLSPTAIIEQLDSVPELPELPELPEPLESVPSRVATTASSVPLVTGAGSNVHDSYCLPWDPLPSEPATKADPTKAEGTKAKATKSKGTKAEGTKAEGTQAEATKAEGTKAEGTKAEGTKAEGTQAKATKSKGNKAEGTKAEGTQAEATKAEGTKAEGTKAEATKAEGTKAEGTKAEGTKADPTRAEGTIADPARADPTIAEGTTEGRTKADRTKADRTKAGRTKADRSVSFKDNPVRLENGEALTADNLSRLATGTTDASTGRPRRKDLEYDTKPKMTAGFYMQEVWEAASTIQTSVLDAKTQKAFARLGPGIVWQDRTQHLVESYASQGKAAAVRELLRAGCNPGTRQKPRWKPLIAAIRAGTQRHNKVVKILLDHGADVNAKHPATGKTSLHFAIENPFFPGYTSIIRILLEHGADANALDKNKDSPLLQILYGGYKALEKHKRDALACLLQDHIDVDVNVTPLGTLDMPIHLAVRRRDAIAVAILIHRGSRVNDANSTGLTPLRIASSSWSETSPEDDIEVLKYLLLGGASVNEATGDAQHTVLEMAARQGCVQAVNLLLSNATGPQVPQMCQAAAKAAKANKSRMSDASYKAIRGALKSAQA